MDKTNKQKQRRQKRIRMSVRGTNDRPRLSIFRSNVAIYAQIIDDANGKTLIGFSEKALEKKSGSNKTERAKAVGIAIAKAAIEKKITSVVFDKGSYRFHGRIKALAEGAREGGLKF